MASKTFPNSPDQSQTSMVNFWSKANQYAGFAPSHRFVARILPFGTASLISQYAGAILADIPFLVESTAFPARGLLNADLRYYGPNFKVPYQTVYEDITLVFLCRNEFYEREFFDNWMEAINPTALYDFFYPETYWGIIELFQLHPVDNHAIYKFTMNKAFPVIVNAQPVTWADDNFHRLAVTFTYRNWIREGLDVQNFPEFDLVADAENMRSGGTTIPIFSTDFAAPKISTTDVGQKRG